MKERNYGIDLLRFVLMYMVCLSHILMQGGILDANNRGSLNFAVYWFIEIIAYSSVDTFALISGYTAKDRPPKIEKIVNMWFQVFFYSFILTFILVITGMAKVGLERMVKLAFPITFKSFWYFTAYFGLFITMPVLNRFIFSANENTAKKALVIIIFVFMGLGIINDPFQTNKGYSMLWLVMLYVFGALSKKIQLFESRKTSTLLLWLILCILINWIILVTTGIGRQIHYLSPTILCCALIQVVLFSRIKFSSRWINSLKKTSKLAFGIYLFQLNYVIWNQVLESRFIPFTKMNPFLGVLSSLLAAAALFFAGFIVEAIRDLLHQKIYIPQLSSIIVNKVQKIMNRLICFIR